MTRFAPAAAIAALTLLSFFQFPGHTYLQQDTQIYTPILEHMRDPEILRNDVLTEQSHVAFTIYDEAAIALRKVTGLEFREVLGGEQLVARGLGIWGLYLIATALGLSAPAALLAAAICSLGVAIAGPAVLTVEYEPTPRAFALPLLLFAVGMAGHRRYLGAGVAAGIAFLYHPPTTLPFVAVFAVLLIARRKLMGLIPLVVAGVILGFAARLQGGGSITSGFFAHLTPFQEQIQRMRVAYVWISTWPASLMVHYAILFAVVLAAWARLVGQGSGGRPAQGEPKDLLDLRIFLLGLPLLGILSMPVSWLLLDRAKWAFVPQVQPLRTLLFVVLFAQLLTAVAGAQAVQRGRAWEAAAWFVPDYLLPLQTVVIGPFVWSRIGLAVVLAALTVFLAVRDWRIAPLVAGTAFFAIPWLGGVVNYPQLHTPELSQLSAWARASTSEDAVFVFPGAGHALYPGIFRSEALRAVYVDWKSGGQVNYLPGFAEQWWFRWQQTMTGGFQASDLPKYSVLGIRYVVVSATAKVSASPVFENGGYVVYAVAR